MWHGSYHDMASHGGATGVVGMYTVWCRGWGVIAQGVVVFVIVEVILIPSNLHKMIFLFYPETTQYDMEYKWMSQFHR